MATPRFGPWGVARFLHAGRAAPSPQNYFSSHRALIFRGNSPSREGLCKCSMAPNCGLRVATTGEQRSLRILLPEAFMKFVHLALAAVATGALLGFLRPASADPMPMDQPVTMN